MQASGTVSYADLVNPHIGRVSHLLKATHAAVMRPHGMAVVTPLYTPNVNDNYLAEIIHGFPVNASGFLPDARKNEDDPPRPYALYDHDRETVMCYLGDMLLEDTDIRVEYTTTEHCQLYRLTFPPNMYGSIRFYVKDGGSIVAGKGTVSGREKQAGVECYFYAKLSVAADKVDKDGGSVTFTFAPKSEPLVVCLGAGMSYIDEKQARANLEAEFAPFDEAVKASRDAWNKALGQIEVFGGSEDERVIFYTSLYRVMNRMQNITEYGRYFSGYDGKVHDAQGHDFYVNDGIWDTYRCAHPLRLLLEEQRQMDIVNSYLTQYQQCGWLPSFPHLVGNRNVMLGKHATAMIVDTWRKGYRGFDIHLAYEAMLKNADKATKMPWTGGEVSEYDECYFEKGFFPALAEGEKETLPSHAFERRQCVAVTLETCYDDWCLAQIAKELGKIADYQRLMKRSENYRKVYNPQTGFMSPRLNDGSWVPGFNPKLSGGMGGRAYFAECNSWTFTWHVQHRIDGLMELMGGKETFAQRLDELFREQYEVSKFMFLGQFPDSTGLIGQFCMGNEPSFHIPYLYNYAGQPWKTQRRLREIMRLWFANTPTGICGDEDGGAMSAWFVFSAMGLYPVCPGKPVYDIGSPIFDEVRIHMEGGNTFRIVAKDQHAKHKYIQVAKLNGVAFDTPWLRHRDLAAGGVLELTMGLRPNKEWGANASPIE